MEVLLNKLFDKHSEGYGVYDRENLIKDICKELQILQLQQTGVSGRSEQLVSFLQWYIKDDMIREKKELIKSVVERYLKETNCH